MLLKPGLEVVATRRQAKASEPQVMLKWLHPPSGACAVRVRAFSRGVLQYSGIYI